MAVNSASARAFVSRPSNTLNWLNMILPAPNGIICMSTPVFTSPSLMLTERANTVAPGSSFRESPGITAAALWSRMFAPPNTGSRAEPFGR